MEYLLNNIVIVCELWRSGILMKILQSHPTFLHFTPTHCIWMEKDTPLVGKGRGAGGGGGGKGAFFCWPE